MKVLRAIRDYHYHYDFEEFGQSKPYFESFFQSQPEYISQYYYHFDISPVAYSLYEQLKHQETIVIAINCGAIPKKDSIVFVIVKSHEGEQFLCCYGQP